MKIPIETNDGSGWGKTGEADASILTAAEIYTHLDELRAACEVVIACYEAGSDVDGPIAEMERIARRPTGSKP